MNAETQEESVSLDSLLEDFFGEGNTIARAKGFTREQIEAIYSISYNFYNQRKFQKAEEAFSFLCLYCHLDVRFWIGLGASREGLGKYEEAIAAYSYSAYLQHDNPLAPLQAAKCYLELGDTDNARKGLTAAIHWAGKNPLHDATLKQASTLLASLNKKQEEKTE